MVVFPRFLNCGLVHIQRFSYTTPVFSSIYTRFDIKQCLCMEREMKMAVANAGEGGFPTGFSCVNWKFFSKVWNLMRYIAKTCNVLPNVSWIRVGLLKNSWKLKNSRLHCFVKLENLSDIDKIIKELIFSSYSSKISLVSGDGPDPPRSIMRENARFFLPNIFG